MVDGDVKVDQALLVSRGREAPSFLLSPAGAKEGADGALGPLKEGPDGALDPLLHDGMSSTCESKGTALGLSFQNSMHSSAPTALWHSPVPSARALVPGH